MEKKKQKILVEIILIIITLSFLLCNYHKYSITLVQLAPQTTRQMMGYVLRTDTGKLILIDGGTVEDANQLIEQIEKNGGKVDAWFLTHAHDDHVGAFTQIINNTNIEIKAIYVSVNDLKWYQENEPQRIQFTKTFLETLKSNKIKDKVIEPVMNEKIKIDDIQIEILGVKNPEITQNPGNEQSMVIKFDTGRQTLLFLGDTGIKSSEKLMETQKDKLKSDIVQMAHHGQAGATKELYDIIRPNICLWPTPEWLWNNDAGEGLGTGPWKTLETRKWMEELNVKEHYIAKDGNLTIQIKS